MPTGPNTPGLRRLGTISSASVASTEGLNLQEVLPDLIRLLDPSTHSRDWRIRPVGVNNASWLLECDHREGFMVKRSSARCAYHLPRARENCDHLVAKFPNILKDPKLAFPHSVIELRSPESKRRLSDLLISRRCRGVQLGRYLADLDLSNPEDQERLENVSAGVGELLADFHKRYSDPSTGEATYHTDFHPSNVLYDVTTDSLTIIDLEGMGMGGISDDAEKFESLLTRLAGPRYGTAFREKYLELVPEEALPQNKAERSSSKSTAASSGTELLYSSSNSLTVSNHEFQHRSTLMVPDTGFDPQHSLVTLTWLVSPGEKLTKPTLQAVRRRKAWLLYQQGRKDGFYLQQMAEDVYGYGGLAVDDRCQDFIEEFPEVLEDPNLAFPHCVIPLQSRQKSAGQVFVARCPCTTTLEQYVTECQDLEGPGPQLRSIFRQVGAQLSETLRKYKTPHTPQLRPSCVLYEAATGHICFADFGWPGDAKNSVSAVDRLSKSLKLFADQSLIEEFCDGYAHTQRSRRRLAWSHVCWGGGANGAPSGGVAAAANGQCEGESSDDETEIYYEETDLAREDTEMPRTECTMM